MIVTVSGESLFGLWADAPERFYPQTWWRDEDFAHQLISGDYSLPEVMPTRVVIDTFALLPAVVWLKAALQGHARVLDQHYVWCRETDQEGNRVYVGRYAQYGGYQVHRHLTIDERWLA